MSQDLSFRSGIEGDDDEDNDDTDNNIIYNH